MNKYYKIRIGDKEFIVDIANNMEYWMRGLGGVKSMKKNVGLLFVYPFPANQTFWMKGMLFPIDIICFDNDNVCVDIFTNCEPPTSDSIVDLVKYSTTGFARTALEVNAGESQGIKKGDKLSRLRSINTNKNLFNY